MLLEQPYIQLIVLIGHLGVAEHLRRIPCVRIARRTQPHLRRSGCDLLESCARVASDEDGARVAVILRVAVLGPATADQMTPRRDRNASLEPGCSDEPLRTTDVPC